MRSISGLALTLREDHYPEILFALQKLSRSPSTNTVKRIYSGCCLPAEHALDPAPSNPSSLNWLLILICRRAWGC